MSETGKFANRIPFEEIDSFSSWKLPSLNDARRTVASVKRPEPKRGKPAPGEGEKVEDLSNNPVPPMTAQQLQEMTREAEREGREQGYQDGYQEGLKAGELKGLQQGEKKAYDEHRNALTERLEHLADLIAALYEPVLEQDQGLENLLVDMAANFARHLINKELSEDPSSLFHLVQQAVSSLPSGVENIRLFLHPDDVELVHEAFALQGRDWQVTADDQLSRGGCRVESKQSLVDFSIEQRIARMLEQADMQGEIDLDTLPPVSDYRPPELESEPEPEPEPEPESGLGRQSDMEPESGSEDAAEIARPEPAEHDSSALTEPASDAQSTEGPDLSEHDDSPRHD